MGAEDSSGTRWHMSMCGDGKIDLKMHFPKHFPQIRPFFPVFCFAFMALSCSDLGNAA